MRRPHDLERGRGDAQPRVVEAREDLAAHRVLKLANGVGRCDEAHGELEPIVGEPVVQGRHHLACAHEIAALELRERRLAEAAELHRVAACRLEQNLW